MEEAPSGLSGVAEADPQLTARLVAGLPAEAAPACIVTTDLFYDGSPSQDGPPRTRAEAWREGPRARRVIVTRPWLTTTDGCLPTRLSERSSSATPFHVPSPSTSRTVW